jgi:hypothetical protein
LAASDLAFPLEGVREQASDTLSPLLVVEQGRGFGCIAEDGAGLRQLSPSSLRAAWMPAATRRRQFVCFGERLMSGRSQVTVRGGYPALTKCKRATTTAISGKQKSNRRLRCVEPRELAARKAAYGDE